MRLEKCKQTNFWRVRDDQGIVLTQPLPVEKARPIAAVDDLIAAVQVTLSTAVVNVPLLSEALIKAGYKPVDEKDRAPSILSAQRL